MNLNHIHLPASVIANLYPHSLIELNENTPMREDIVLTKRSGKSGDEWKYLGENKKNILVVVNYHDAAYLPDEELSFLTNMLTACRLNLGDVAIVNRNNYSGSDYKDLLAQFSSKIVFLFGIDPVSFGMPVSFPHFQVQSFAKTTFLFTPATEEIKKDELLKSKLWVCLRRIFGI
ncbi:MAG: hypothetical protein Q8941_04950 [Bacteroidota bacterium]|nr:hypothetical protein [Bacteroidota bacterium]